VHAIGLSECTQAFATPRQGADDRLTRSAAIHTLRIHLIIGQPLAQQRAASDLAFGVGVSVMGGEELVLVSDGWRGRQRERKCTAHGHCHGVSVRLLSVRSVVVLSIYIEPDNMHSISSIYRISHIYRVKGKGKGFVRHTDV
jgi:hypothetical protein